MASTRLGLSEREGFVARQKCKQPDHLSQNWDRLVRLFLKWLRG